MTSMDVYKKSKDNDCLSSLPAIYTSFTLEIGQHCKLREVPAMQAMIACKPVSSVEERKAAATLQAVMWSLSLLLHWTLLSPSQGSITESAPHVQGVDCLAVMSLRFKCSAVSDFKWPGFSYLILSY